MHMGHIMVVEDSDEDFDTVQDAAKRSGLQQPSGAVRAEDGCG